MYRIFSGRVGKPSPRRGPPSFLASLVAITNGTPTNENSKTVEGTSKPQDKEDGVSSHFSDPASYATDQLYTNELISFYTHPNGGCDSEGRTLSEVLRFPDRDLELHHDYIQWLFPLPELSPFNPEAPQIDQLTAEAFRTRPELRDRMRESLIRMLNFYGFEVVPQSGCFRVQEASNIDFQYKARFWLCRFDHNHLRITRIIRCLRVLGLEQEATELHRALVRAATPRPGRRGVGERTLMFWMRAAKRPLQVPPTDESFNDEDLEGVNDGDGFGGGVGDGGSGSGPIGKISGEGV